MGYAGGLFEKSPPAPPKTFHKGLLLKASVSRRNGGGSFPTNLREHGIQRAVPVFLSNFCSWRGVKSFNYWFFLNNLYDSSVKFEEKYDTMIEIKMEHNSELRGYHKHEILFEDWTEEEYRELLNKMLHSYFDPYKADALQFLKDNDYRMALSKKARIYLGLV